MTIELWLLIGNSFLLLLSLGLLGWAAKTSEETRRSLVDTENKLEEARTNIERAQRRLKEAREVHSEVLREANFQLRMKDRYLGSSKMM